jgi:hypothetical protein
MDGTREIVAHVPQQPSGLGFLADGRMLIVSMRDRKVLRREVDGSLVEHADLSGLAPWHLYPPTIFGQTTQTASAVEPTLVLAGTDRFSELHTLGIRSNRVQGSDRRFARRPLHNGAQQSQ